MNENFFNKDRFDNFSEYAKAIHAFDIEIRQLEEGKINDTFIQMRVDDIFLVCADFTGLTHQWGNMPPGRTFAFLTGENPKLLWRKKEISTDNLMIFPLGAKLDAVTKGSKNTIHAISMPEEILISRLTKHEQVIYQNLILNDDLISIDHTRMTNMQEILNKYIQSANDNPELVNEKNFSICLQEELLSSLMEVLFSKKDSAYPEVKESLNETWNQIENYVDTHKNRPIMVSELSREIGIPERSLSRLFNKRFTISPKSYLMKLRLNRVNEILLQSKSDDTNVNTTAYNWGFWHMGQFSADYKKLFGELPSTTLAKR